GRPFRASPSPRPSLRRRLPASAASDHAGLPAASPRRGRHAGHPAGARTRELAFPDRFGEERREHLLHRARPALRAGGRRAAVLFDLLLLAEARFALRAAILVDRPAGINFLPSVNGGQVDWPMRPLE